jgi:hypothetical protein
MYQQVGLKQAGLPGGMPVTGLGKYAASATLEGAGGGAALNLGPPPTEIYGGRSGGGGVGWRGEIDALAAAGIPVPGR